MLKKFLLVAGLAMLERGSSPQLLLAIFVAFLYLVAQINTVSASLGMRASCPHIGRNVRPLTTRTHARLRRRRCSSGRPTA